MPPLRYHAGQIAIQEEAKTRVVADKLARWVGPVQEFALGADLILLAMAGANGVLHFTVISGAPPLVEVDGPATLRLPVPPERVPPGAAGIPCGGLAINLGQARRARINGWLRPAGNGCTLEAEETFTLCRKYMAPSLALAGERRVGPAATEPLDLEDAWFTDLVAGAETTFLASASPDGGPDVAHRGGPPGFLNLDPAARQVSWPEYVGDGIFKSAGNVRASGAFTLLVVDLATGEGAELIGRGAYTNTRTERGNRMDPLVRHKDPFPVQGVITGEVHAALRLRSLMQPRQRTERAVRVTSASAVHEQAPQ